MCDVHYISQFSLAYASSLLWQWNKDVKAHEKKAKGIQKYPWILLTIQKKSRLIVNISQGTNSVVPLL